MQDNEACLAFAGVVCVPWKGSGLLGPAAAAFGVGLGELGAEEQD
jgi:hypothetical protein